MQKRQSADHPPRASSAKRPLVYTAPTLTVYGSVAKLTQGGSFSGVDGVNTMMMEPPGQG